MIRASLQSRLPDCVRIGARPVGRIVALPKRSFGNAARRVMQAFKVPLQSVPNQPLPAGTHQLKAATADGAAQSARAVQIR